MQTLRLNSDAVSWREVNGEVIALRHESSEYLSTNGTGTLIWTALADGASRLELAELLVSRFGIDADRAAADVDAFVDLLASRGLLAA